MNSAVTTMESAQGAVSRLTAVLRTWRVALIALVALAQAGVLVWMVAGRERLLTTGREITLDVKPVDPRSLFRGDYVILGYDISQLPLAMFSRPVREGDAVYVTLAREGEGWKAKAATAKRPAGVTPEDVVLAARVRFVSRGGSPTELVTLSYGIESFFVPEGTGRAIETEIRPGKVKAHVVIGDDGTAALKGLTVDGQRIEAEPLL